MEDFVQIDLFSFGNLGNRGFLARFIGPNVNSPEAKLLAEACRLSLRSARTSPEFEALLQKHTPNLDPLWPALARHLVRASTPEDRALLIDLAQHPEKREPPLQWALQFIVRGDVMMDDGSILTLDEIYKDAGLEPLPYLEDMPPELEVDWDAPEEEA